jgi:hypothetical protein
MGHREIPLDSSGFPAYLIFMPPQKNPPEAAKTGYK